MSRLWRNYSLSIVLASLFLVSWVLQTWTGWVEFAAEQRSHGEAARWFGETGYFWRWGQATFENWQSEFLQLFSFVVLAALLIHRGSAESKDSNDRIEETLSRIEEKLDRASA